MFYSNNLYLSSSRVNGLSQGLNSLSNFFYSPHSNLYPDISYEVITIENNDAVYKNLFRPLKVEGSDIKENGRLELTGRKQTVLNIVKKVFSIVFYVPGVFLGSIFGAAARMTSPELRRCYNDLTHMSMNKNVKIMNLAAIYFNLESKNDEGFEKLLVMTNSLDNQMDLLSHINTKKYSVFEEKINQILEGKVKSRLQEILKLTKDGKVIDNASHTEDDASQTENEAIYQQALEEITKGEKFKTMVHKCHNKIWIYLIEQYKLAQHQSGFFEDLFKYQELYKGDHNVQTEEDLEKSNNSINKILHLYDLRESTSVEFENESDNSHDLVQNGGYEDFETSSDPHVIVEGVSLNEKIENLLVDFDKQLDIDLVVKGVRKKEEDEKYNFLDYL